MPLWKRLVLINASAGAGFALILSLIFGGYVWYTSSPKPWNKNAIKASFHHLGTEGENNNIVFHYILENKTSSDFRMGDDSGAIIMGKAHVEQSLIQDDQYFKIHYPVFPVFIPAKQRAVFAIRVRHAYAPERLPADSFSNDKDKDIFDSSRKTITVPVEELFRNDKQKDIFDRVAEEQKRLAADYFSNDKNKSKLDPSGEELAAYVNKELTNLGGFVLFDNENRYQIDFPRGW